MPMHLVQPIEHHKTMVLLPIQLEYKPPQVGMSRNGNQIIPQYERPG